MKSIKMKTKSTDLFQTEIIKQVEDSLKHEYIISFTITVKKKHKHFSSEVQLIVHIFKVRNKMRTEEKKRFYQFWTTEKKSCTFVRKITNDLQRTQTKQINKN